MVRGNSDKQAGRLRYYVNEWKKLTTDPFILDLVQGAHIKFSEGAQLGQLKEIRPYNMSDVEVKIVDEEINRLLDKGVIKKIVKGEERFLSNVFIRQKKNGKYRLILNLKELNEEIEYKKFKMETLETIVKLVRPNCFMASLDLSDAYYTVPVAREHQKYLCFPWVDHTGNKSIYAFTCFPNGLTSAPRDFTKLLKPPLASLRLSGVTIAAYIDDTYLQGETETECLRNVQMARELLEKLGFVINIEKSVFQPTQHLIMLGFLLDSTDMTVRLTKEKTEKILKLCSEKRLAKKCKIRDLAKLIGNLVAAFPGVEFGPLHYREMERKKSTELKQNKGDFNKIMYLTDEIYEELDWWIGNVRIANRKIDHGQPEITIRTDASKLGWGATSQGETTGGRWNEHETSEHINALELQAGFFGLKSLLDSVRHKHIRLELDNATAVCYINAMGGSVSPKCNYVAKNIWKWAMERDIWLSACHIPGTQNVAADQASRVFNDRTEWMLDGRVFKEILGVFNLAPTVDLFASRLNTQLPKFVSWQPDPEALHIDAFKLNWADIDGYMFPPFSLVNSCLQKLMLEQAKAVLIVPLWPNQPWFSMLMKCLINYPLVLPKNCISLPENSKTSPPPKLRLIAVEVSGKRLETMDFLRKQPVTWSKVGKATQKSSMTQSLANGESFVVDGRLVKMNQIYPR